MSDASILRFGAFELHPGSGELRRHGDLVKLPPQPFKVLEVLVRRGGEVVTREEIREHVWHGDTFVDFDQGLNFCIRQIREALGDTAESPQFIETLPRRGYRFVVPVESADIERREAPTRLIVLPFRMLRPDAETDFLAFSLPDALTNSLSGLESLVVRSSLAASRFGGDGLDPRKIGAEADVDVIVTGTLLRAGDGIRVSSQLTDASAGTLLWSHATRSACRRPVSGPGRAGPPHRRLAVVAADRARTAHAPERRAVQQARVRGLPARQSAQSRREAVERRARPLRALRRGRPALRAGVGAPRANPSRDGEVPRDRERKRSWIARRRRSAGRSTSIPTWRSLTSSTPNSKSISGARTMRWCASWAGARSADPELCAGLVSTCRYCGLLDASVAADALARRLEPRIRTSVPHTWFLQGDHRRVASQKLHENPYIVALSLGALGRQQEAISALRELEKTTRRGCATSWWPRDAARRRRRAKRRRGQPDRGLGLPGSRRALLSLAASLASSAGDAGARALRTRRRGRLLLLSGHGPRSVARSAAQEARVHETASSGRDPASRGCGSVR